MCIIYLIKLNVFQIFHLWYARCAEPRESKARFLNFRHTERRAQAKGRVSITIIDLMK